MKKELTDVGRERAVRVPPCFLPPLDMQPRACPRVARYTSLRGLQRVRWAPLRCKLRLTVYDGYVPVWHSTDCDVALLTEQARGGVRKV